MPEQHVERKSVSLEQAWQLLQAAGSDWEILERNPKRLVLGRPRLRRGPRVSGTATVVGPDSREGVFGVRILAPDHLAGARWTPNAEEATEEFRRLLATHAAQTAGEERLFRLELVIDGKVADTQLVATGEIVDRPIIDSLALTYLGVLLTIGLTLGFGIGGAIGWMVAAVASVSAVLATRSRRVQRGVGRLVNIARLGND